MLKKLNSREKEIIKELKEKGINSITVVFPPFKSSIASQNRETTEIKTFEIAEETDFPKGKADIVTLAANIDLWQRRGYKITFNK